MLDILHPYNEVSGDISDEYLMEVIDIDGISENDVVLDLPLDTFESASLDLGWGNEDFTLLAVGRVGVSVLPPAGARHLPVLDPHPVEAEPLGNPMDRP